MVLSSVVGGASLHANAQLRQGTPVELKLTQFISSETSTPGDPLRFEVAADVVADGVVVIRQGTLATGTIVEASPAKLRRSWLLWRHGPESGRLRFSVTTTTAVDGQTIRLQSPRDMYKRGMMAGGSPPLLKWEHEGARFGVRVDGDYVVQTAR